ncbi:hypothetical protein K0I73_10760 [Shewanella mesophila]|nr:hypothetical protein K0I73_10760 [Shewanella mesophila]
MTHDQLKQEFSLKQMDLTIINTADSTHYLSGGEDKQGNFYALTDKQNHPIAYPSLEQAKTKMKLMGVSQATFELNTAYDEMIRVAANNQSKSSINLQF